MFKRSLNSVSGWRLSSDPLTGFFLSKERKDIRPLNYPKNKKIIGRLEIANAHSKNI